MKAVLNISITYDIDETLTDKKIRRALDYAAAHLASNGLLSPEDSTVTQWNYSVSIIEDTPVGQLPLYKHIP
jgi:hypothetical protein